MTLQGYIDIFQRIPSGGVFTDENRFDVRFVETAVHRFRALAIFNYWQKFRRVNPVWTQQHTPTFKKDLQEDNCKVIFECPPPISLGTLMDGFLYIGTVDGNCAYRKVVNRSQMANINVHRNMKPTLNQVDVLYSDGMLECYGNTDMQEIRVDGLFMDPTQVPTFNKFKDEYPVSLDIFEAMKVLAFETEQKIIIARPIDVKPDSQDSGAAVPAS
jgi:hypothetical protein